MGMYDDVKYETICPVCHAKVDGFQSKDGGCLLDLLKPSQVNNFYTHCQKCGCWIKYTRIKSGEAFPHENIFKRVVEGKYTRMLREPMPQHTKLVQIDD